MVANDQKKFKIAREYFTRSDQGRPDVLALFHEDAEIYFPKFGFGLDGIRFLKRLKDSKGILECIRHDYDRLTFIPSAGYLIVEGTSPGRMSRKSRARQNSWRAIPQHIQVS
jgi:hypothetical protein